MKQSPYRDFEHKIWNPILNQRNHLTQVPSIDIKGKKLKLLKKRKKKTCNSNGKLFVDNILFTKHFSLHIY